MNREEWQRRYKAQLRRHRPTMTFDDWTEEAERRAHADLTGEGQYPDAPEEAADNEVMMWEQGYPGNDS